VPLVDAQTWQAANDQIRRNQTSASRNNRSPESFLLRGGFVVCSHCGRPFACNTTGGRLRYYRSTRNQKTHGCPSTSITSPQLDDYVWSYVKSILEHPYYIHAYAEQQAEADSTENDLRVIDRQLVKLAQDIENVQAGMREANNPRVRAIIMSDLEKLLEQQEAAQRHRQDILDIRATHERTAAMLNRLNDVIERRWAEIEIMTYAEKRDMLRLLGVSVRVLPTSPGSRGNLDKRVIIDMAFDLAELFDFDPVTRHVLESSDEYNEEDDDPNRQPQWSGVVEMTPLRPSVATSARSRDQTIVQRNRAATLPRDWPRRRRGRDERGWP